MLWLVAIVGILCLGGGAYREYFAENEDEQGEGSIVTNGLFIAGVAMLLCVGLYVLYRSLTG